MVLDSLRLCMPLLRCRRELERYRRFGDLCSAARQREYKEYEFVLEQLKEMATALEHLGYIFDQAWFQEVSMAMVK